MVRGLKQREIGGLGALGSPYQLLAAVVIRAVPVGSEWAVRRLGLRTSGLCFVPSLSMSLLCGLTSYNHMSLWCWFSCSWSVPHLPHSWCAVWLSGFSGHLSSFFFLFFFFLGLEPQSGDVVTRTLPFITFPFGTWRFSPSQGSMQMGNTLYQSALLEACRKSASSGLWLEKKTGTDSSCWLKREHFKASMKSGAVLTNRAQRQSPLLSHCILYAFS